MTDLIKQKLQKLAKRECWCEDEFLETTVWKKFNPMDCSGGNFDDAYWGGYEDGQAQLAAEILRVEGISEK
jgi:hypothetical protein